MLRSGLYEQIINEELNTELSTIPEERRAEKEIDPAEASQILADYVAEIVKKGLDQVADEGDALKRQISLTNEIVQTLQEATNDPGFQALSVADRLCLTEIDDTPVEADAFFPPYDDWKEVWREEHAPDEKHQYRYAFVDYVPVESREQNEE